MKLADGQSLLQKAFLRATSLPNVAQVLTIGAGELFFRIDEEIRQVNSAGVFTSYILEPTGRNTAAAVATACLHAKAAHGEDVILVVLAADHLIQDLDGLSAAVGRATELAGAGKLVTFGIRPTAAETGFGYIETKGEEVIRFVEKPVLEKAREFVEAGNFLWNSGIFCFSVKTMLEELQAHSPDLLEAVSQTIAKSKKSENAECTKTELDPAFFARVPEDSIDFAVMERSANVAVVPCDIGWSDIGSWAAVSDLLTPDEAGNRVVGDVWVQDARNCHIQSDGRMVGVVGVEDLIVVDTPDALLIADRNSAQKVKNLYSSLQAKNHEAHSLHRTVHRPWGTYTVLEGGAGFKLKRIEVKPQASLSLQMHWHRSEHWVVVSGVAEVVNGEETIVLRANESTYIPAGTRHRLTNKGVVGLVMIEVQCGEYLGEDDIVRFDDIYGRVESNAQAGTGGKP